MHQGFNMKSLTIGNTVILLKEIGGALQKYWPKYLSGIHAVIFVVDATKGEELLKPEFAMLNAMLVSPATETVPILIVANKQDKPNVMRMVQVCRAFKAL